MQPKDTIYEEGFVKQTPYYHQEVSPVMDGEAGEPLSYSIANDSIVGMSVIFCILVTILTTAHSWRFIAFSLRNLFRTYKGNTGEMRETVNEMQYLLFLCIQGLLLFALFAYSLTRHFIGDDYAVTDYTVMGIYLGAFAAYSLLVEILHDFMLPIFYDKTQRKRARHARLFLTAGQGILMLPVMLMHLYFHLDTEITLNIVLGIVSVTLLLRFYKAFCIFFRKKHLFLQFFLYLCTLEAVPLLLLTGILLTIANYLKINI